MTDGGIEPIATEAEVLGPVAWFRAWRARVRLRAHMYDRLRMGGTPDCSCGRCVADRRLLERLGQAWDEPEANRWWAEHNAAVADAYTQAERRAELAREPSAELDPYRPF